MAEQLYACCQCCRDGVDSELHADPEFEGHDIICVTCGQTWGDLAKSVTAALSKPQTVDYIHTELTGEEKWIPLQILIDAMTTGGAELQISDDEPARWSGIHPQPHETIVWERTIKLRLVGRDRRVAPSRGPVGNGDVRCPRDGEKVNRKCWKCGWERG